MSRNSEQELGEQTEMHGEIPRFYHSTSVSVNRVNFRRMCMRLSVL